MATRVIDRFECPRGSVQIVYEHRGTTHLAESRCLYSVHPDDTSPLNKGTLITCLWCMRDWP